MSAEIVAQLVAAGAYVTSGIGDDRAATSVAIGKLAGIDALCELIVQLPRVVGLHFHDNDLTDTAFAVCTRLPHVAKCSLLCTRVSTAVFPLLSRWPMLRKLCWKSDMALDGALAHLAACPKLEELDLSGTVLSDDDLRDLAPLRGLRSLTLSGCPVCSGLSVVSQLRQLRTLDVSATLAGNEFVRSLEPLERLEYLDLSKCPITDNDLGDLPPLPRLEALDLSKCPISDAGLDRIPQTAAPKTLKLDNSLVTCHGVARLARLTALERMIVRRLPIDDEGVEALTGLTQLQSLYLWQTCMSPRQGFRLRSALPLCGISVDDPTVLRDPKSPMLENYLRQRGEECEFDDNGYIAEFYPPSQGADEFCETFGSVWGIFSLAFDYSDLTDRGMRALRGAPTLESLSLANSRISYRGCLELPTMPQLSGLTISLAQGMSEALSSIGRCSQLQMLHITHSSEIDPGANSLADLRLLEELHVSQTPWRWNLAVLASLKLLRLLTLMQTELRPGALQPIAWHPRLEDLTVSSAVLSTADVRALLSCRHLQRLSLVDVVGADHCVRQLDQLPSLERVLLARVRLNDAAVRVLCELKTLRKLDVSDCGLTLAQQNDVIEQLHPTCPHIKIQTTHGGTLHIREFEDGEDSQRIIPVDLQFTDILNRINKRFQGPGPANPLGP